MRGCRHIIIARAHQVTYALGVKHSHDGIDSNCINPLVDVRRCVGCGAWLSLGPANDSGPHAEQVAQEIAAASRLFVSGSLTMHNGYYARAGDEEPGHDFGLADWHVGWLLHAMTEQP